MRYATILAGMLWCSSALATDPITDLKEKCASDFPDDFSTRKYCVDRGTEAAHWIWNEFKLTSKSHPAFLRCVGDFYPDHSTAAYCIRRTIEASGELEMIAQEIEDDKDDDKKLAYIKCSEDFEDDIPTLLYCLKRQLTAIEELRR